MHVTASCEVSGSAGDASIVGSESTAYYAHCSYEHAMFPVLINLEPQVGCGR